MAKHYVGTRSDLHDHRLMVDLPDGEAVLILDHSDRLWAVGAMCPHQFAPLIGGDVEDGVLTCPLHGWRFALADGKDPDNPFACVATWPCGEDDTGIWVDLAGRQGDVF